MRSEKTLREALGRNPLDVSALLELATLAGNLGHALVATRLRRMAVAAEPGGASAWAALAEEQDGARAVLASARACVADPTDAVGLVVAARSGALPIEGALRGALSLDPAQPDGLHGWADLRWMMADVAGAEGWGRRARAAGCTRPELQFQLGAHLVRKGDYAAGLPLLESRFYFRGASNQLDSGAVWRGEALAGRTLLLCGEQGIGDVVQTLRFIPALKARGARIALCVPPAMVTFARRVPDVDWVVGLGQPIPDYDLHCEMMSLMLRLGVRADTIPPPGRIAVDPMLLPRDREGPIRIGLAWGGNAGHLLDTRRSLPLEQAKPWFEHPGIEWHSLQIGVGGDRIADLGLSGVIGDHRAAIRDVDDLSRLIAGLDLVISVDSAPAHLAGVLGVPAWVMLYAPSEWRWGEADRTAWYPAHRLFRQRRPGDWRPVVAAIAQALDGLPTPSPAPATPSP